MRSHFDGRTETERTAIASLHVAHFHSSIAALVATNGQAHAPPLTDFLPDVPESEKSDEPVDFDAFAGALLGTLAR